VIIRAMSFVSRILGLQDSRYIVNIYLALLARHKSAPNTRFNWISQLNNIIAERMPARAIEISENFGWEDNPKAWVEDYRLKLWNEDKQLMAQSPKYQILSNSIPNTAECQKYLIANNSINITRLIMQTRINMNAYYHNKTSYILTGQICTYCRLFEEDNLSHFLYRCLLHTYYRQDLMLQHDANLQDFLNQFPFQDKDMAFKFLMYVTHAIKSRVFIDAEDSP